jgi:O-antigen/teichoic acid export membrane protein
LDNLNECKKKPKDTKLVKNSVIAFAVKIFSSIIGFATTIIIARNFTAVESGLYFVSISIISVCLAFSSLGLNDLVLKLIANFYKKDELEKANGIFYKSSIWVLIASLTFVLILYFSSSFIASTMFHDETLTPTLKVFSFAIPFMALLIIQSNAIQGLGRVWQSMCLTGPIQNIVIILCLTVCGVTTSIGGAIAYIAGAITSFLFGLFVWRKYLGVSRHTTHGNDIFLVSCFPMLAVQVLIQVNTHASSLLLGLVGSINEVGYFAVGLRVATLIGFVLLAVNRVVAPQFAQIFNDNKIDDLQQLVTKASRLMVVSCLPGVLLMFFFPVFIMSLFGEEFKAFSNVLRILAFGQCVNVLTGNVGLLLSMTGHEKIQRNCMFFAVIGSIILGLLLIPSHDAVGAAIMVSFGVITNNLLAWFFVYKKVGVNTLKLY